MSNNTTKALAAQAPASKRRRGWGHTARVDKVNDRAIVTEHVDLLDAGDVVDLQALQGGLELLLVRALLVYILDLSAHGALATDAGTSPDLLQSLQTLSLSSHTVGSSGMYVSVVFCCMVRFPARG